MAKRRKNSNFIKYGSLVFIILSFVALVVVIYLGITIKYKIVPRDTSLAKENISEAEKKENTDLISAETKRENIPKNDSDIKNIYENNSPTYMAAHVQDTEETDEKVEIEEHYLQNENINAPQKDMVPDQKTVDNYWSDTVFIGDSIMCGFEAYMNNRGIMGEPTVIALTGYSVANALMPAGQTEHPRYRGIEEPLADLTAEINPETIVMSIGINDINCYDPPVCFDNYKEFINELFRVNSNLKKVYINSVTPICRGMEHDRMNNRNVTCLNNMLKELCVAEKKLCYIGWTDRIMTPDGYLASEYSSDGNIHINDLAYDVWADMYKGIAVMETGGTYRAVYE